jgi:electron transfer flavoprotein beta subunit
MRIIVCAKQIQFTYTRSGSDPVKNYIAPEDNIFCINPYDEAALEIALGFKDREKSIEVFILTLGPLIAEKELRRCSAPGADAVYRGDTEDDYDSWAKSMLLAQAIRELKADLILCGKESLDKQNGQVGPFIAHHLELPFVSNVIQVETGLNRPRPMAKERQESGSLDHTKIKILRNAGKGVTEEIGSPLPAVLSVSGTGMAQRLPSYEQNKQSMITPFRIVDVDTEHVSKKVVRSKTFQPRPRPKRVLTPDSSKPAFERINQLLAGSTVEKKGAMLAGDTASQVEGIISYLSENGFLDTKNSISKKKA